MNRQSDADSLHSQVVLLRIQGKTTEELQVIWQENDKSKWSKEDFDAVQKVLMERVGKLPEQKSIEKSGEQIMSVSRKGDTENSVGKINSKKTTQTPLLPFWSDRRQKLQSIFFMVVAVFIFTLPYSIFS